MIIAIITDNYAVTTKEAQLNTRDVEYGDFVSANCSEKQKMAMNTL